MTAIKINDQLLADRLIQVGQRLANPSALAAAIAATLGTVVDDNFDKGGRPEWAGRSVTTLKIYASKGISFKGVLQCSGELRARVVTSHTKDEAIVSNNLPYAAAMQFGIKQGESGRTKRGGPIPFGDIPARPFIGIDTDGNLQKEAEDEIFLM
ncbi:phage virion morphogenesis protein [Acinetobacter proteolyticus]|nr:phage virion morphogenesis protein [Acinetobacter proteolyticus]WEI18197.1 phage virion morphogenesis protein [Acinetobacter proteolyticus]